jgi:hypothetical protein
MMSCCCRAVDGSADTEFALAVRALGVAEIESRRAELALDGARWALSRTASVEIQDVAGGEKLISDWGNLGPCLVDLERRMGVPIPTYGKLNRELQGR